MNVLNILKMSFHNVLINKVRSFLTILGIVIGISSVIALMALGQGAQQAITESISSLGSNLIVVFPGQMSSGPASVIGSTSTIDKKDYDYLNNKLRFPEITEITPYIRANMQLTENNNNFNALISGVDFNMGKIQPYELNAGNFFTKSQVENEANVAVIGPKIMIDLFDETNPQKMIGKTITLKQQSFKIIGVLATRGSSAYVDRDSEIYVPYKTLMNKVLSKKNYTSIYTYISDPKLIDAAAVRIEQKLSAFRNKTVKEKDFTVFTSDDILQTAGQITAIFTTLLSSIAAISLLVGGIGISNIMLVTVTERTKEIGLRKAIGAKPKDIMSQFLAEAVVLTLLGGIIGITLGISMAFILGSLANIQAVLSIESIILATSVSAVIGIIFGFYPAYRAAKLDPIVALRYE